MTAEPPPPDPAGAPSLGPGAALAQALAARLCHDLVGPVGAVANGADLLVELDAGAAAEVALVAESARRAAGLLAFQRLAFGPATAASPAVPRAALLATIGALFEGPRVALAVSGAEGPALGRPAARAAALACLCARGLLGMRGTVALALPAGDGLPLEAVAEGGEPARQAEALLLLAGGAGEVLPDPRLVEYLLLPAAVAEAGGRLGVEAAGGRVRLSVGSA